MYVLLSKRSLDILIIFSYMENSKFTESVFQDMKYNLQGRLSRFLILMHKIALKWPKSN